MRNLDLSQQRAQRAFTESMVSVERGKHLEYKPKIPSLGNAFDFLN